MEGRVVEGMGWLGGRIWVERGGRGDYVGLERFHYLGGRPATWAGVWVVRFEEREGGRETDAKPQAAGGGVGGGGGAGVRVGGSRVIGVGVVSYPTPSCLVRERVLGLSGMGGGRYGERLRWVNENLRTISRVVVHPQFRGVGVASRLVRFICEDCGSRYVEAIAAMGRVHPFFEKGGMRRYDGEGGRGYFLWGRGGSRK